MEPCNIPASMKASPTWTAQSDQWWATVNQCILPGASGPPTPEQYAAIAAPWLGPQAPQCPGGMIVNAAGQCAPLPPGAQPGGPITLPTPNPPIIPLPPVAPVPIDLTQVNPPVQLSCPSGCVPGVSCPMGCPIPAPGSAPSSPALSSAAPQSSYPTGYILPAVPNVPGGTIYGGPTTQPGIWSAPGVPYIDPTTGLQTSVDPTTGLVSYIDPSTGMPVTIDPTTGLPATTSVSSTLSSIGTSLSTTLSSLPSWAVLGAIAGGIYLLTRKKGRRR